MQGLSRKADFSLPANASFGLSYLCQPFLKKGHLIRSYL